MKAEEPVIPFEADVGNSARRLPKATAGPTRAALSP